VQGLNVLANANPARPFLQNIVSTSLLSLQVRDPATQAGGPAG